jgi:hypothetical protein
MRICKLALSLAGVCLLIVLWTLTVNVVVPLVVGRVQQYIEQGY